MLADCYEAGPRYCTAVSSTARQTLSKSGGKKLRAQEALKFYGFEH
jgi:hypothetical protein